MKRIDRHGLHALDCPCAPCEAGFRPTPRRRENAARAWAAAERRKKEKEEQSKREAQEKAASSPGGKTAAHMAALEAETQRALQALRPPERPATADELREMRLAFFPQLKRRGDENT